MFTSTFITLAVILEHGKGTGFLAYTWLLMQMHSTYQLACKSNKLKGLALVQRIATLAFSDRKVLEYGHYVYYIHHWQASIAIVLHISSANIGEVSTARAACKGPDLVSKGQNSPPIAPY